MDYKDLSEEERVRLYAVVVNMAFARTRSWDAARATANEAFTRLTTTRRWDPKKQPSLDQHLADVVRSLVSRDRTAASRRPRYENAAAAEQAPVTGTVAPSAEAMVIEREQAEREAAIAVRRAAALREKLGGREPEVTIFALMHDDVTRPADLAKRSGHAVPEINKALARIRRYARSIVAAERGETPSEEVP